MPLYLRHGALATAIAVAVGLALTSLQAAALAQGIVAADAKWEALPKGGRIFGEGVVAAKDGTIYLTDITAVPNPDENPGGTIYRFDPATGAIAKHLEPSGLANGLHIDKSGRLLIAQFSGPKGLRRVAAQNLATGAVTVLAETFDGKKLSGPNDLTSDAQGRIYFTDALYGAQDTMEAPNAVYRIDPDGKLTRIVDNIFRPNGIEVSPDGRTLYVGACNAKHLRTNPHGPEKDAFGIEVGGIVAYDLADGRISNGRVIYQNGICTDGMALDTHGNVYVALHNGNRQAPTSEIVVLDRTGKVVQQLPVPEGANLVTNLGFGRGADANSLYLAAGAPWAFFRIKTSKKGHYFE